MVLENACLERVVVLVSDADDAAVSPVTGRRGQGVFEAVRPMLELEVRAVRGRPPRRVDPDAGRPAAARPHQRQIETAVGFDVEARHATIENRQGPIADRSGPAIEIGRLGDRDRAVVQIGDQGVEGSGRRLRVLPGDDEDRQVARLPEVGDVLRANVRTAVVGNPQPGVAVGGKLAVQLTR